MESKTEIKKMIDDHLRKTHEILTSLLFLYDLTIDERKAIDELNERLTLCRHSAQNLKNTTEK